jgi:hypothetical protein
MRRARKRTLPPDRQKSIALAKTELGLATGSGEVRRWFWLDGRQSGGYPETGFAEARSHLLKSASRATCATDAAASNVSSTIRRFSSTDRRKTLTNSRC